MNRDPGAKYLTCPKEEWCTPSMKMTKFDEQVLEISNRAYFNGAMCMYWFKFNVDARQKDILTVRIENM